MAARRSLLRLGLAGAALLALGGGLAALFQPGLQGGKLTAAGRQQLGPLARALLEGALPAEDAALQAHLDRFEETLAAFPPAVQAELQQLIALVASAAGRLGLLGRAASLAELPLAELQALLQSMRLSRLALRQQAYFALRDLTMAAYFAQPSSWGALGYPGPRPI